MSPDARHAYAMQLLIIRAHPPTQTDNTPRPCSMLVARCAYELWPHEPTEIPLAYAWLARAGDEYRSAVHQDLAWPGVHARLIRCLIGQARDQLLGRRHLDAWCWDRQLTGIQDNLFRPFALGSDPDRRPVNDLRPIRKTLRVLRQRPAGYQQKKSKRASDNYKIFGNGHSRWFP